MQLPVYQLDVDEFDETTGMFLISFVDQPAMQVAAVKLADQPAPLVTLKATDEYKRYLTSAVIVPDKPIYRRDADGTEYYITYSAEAVEKIRNKFFLSTGNLSLSNKNHVETDTVQAQLIESWIITDPAMDKAVALGFSGLPAGTMMATYKVQDEAFWNAEVLTGNVTGFSLEGRFQEASVKAQAQEEAPSESLEDVLDYLLSL